MIVLNPDFKVEIVMKDKKAMKTSVCADFLVENILKYGNIKKASKRLYLQHFFLVIDFNWKFRVNQLKFIYN
jgi:hypothetical protein